MLLRERWPINKRSFTFIVLVDRNAASQQCCLAAEIRMAIVAIVPTSSDELCHKKLYYLLLILHMLDVLSGLFSFWTEFG
ncbi:jg14318 [Pararge aegeria aegeria]|uniref:Jg14318 protein n=1 Tax=Pararge aegeria aegeria TaxID=348720 RepID=A0A8S4R6S3_9NEOP|nr:jg14318 [Pararge aegeria aegeria]